MCIFVKSVHELDLYKLEDAEFDLILGKEVKDLKLKDIMQNQTLNENILL